MNSECKNSVSEKLEKTSKDSDRSEGTDNTQTKYMQMMMPITNVFFVKETHSECHSGKLLAQHIMFTFVIFVGVNVFFCLR